MTTSSSLFSSSSSAASSAMPVDIPSRHNVDIQVVNDASVDLWVVTAGWFCQPLGVLSVGNGLALTIPLALGFQCGCECPNPGPPQPIQYERVPPGGAHSMRWDGRGVVPWVETRDCGDMRTTPVFHEVFQPVAAGRYNIFVAVLQSDAPPPGCSSVNGTRYTCGVMQGGLTTFPAFQAQCQAGGSGFTATPSAMVTIPESGDVSAVIHVPNLGG